MCIEIENTGVGEWLDVLKPYQREHVRHLLQDTGNDPEAAAEAWVSADGSSATLGFGAKLESKPFFDRLKVELQKFICGHPDYADDRRKLGAEAPITKTVLVTVASGAVAVKLGVLVSLVVPAVALLLFAAGKVGVNAYCHDCDWKDERADPV